MLYRNQLVTSLRESRVRLPSHFRLQCECNATNATRTTQRSSIIIEQFYCFRTLHRSAEDDDGVLFFFSSCLWLLLVCVNGRQQILRWPIWAKPKDSESKGVINSGLDQIICVLFTTLKWTRQRKSTITLFRVYGARERLSSLSIRAASIYCFVCDRAGQLRAIWHNILNPRCQCRAVDNWHERNENNAQREVRLYVVQRVIEKERVSHYALRLHFIACREMDFLRAFARKNIVQYVRTSVLQKEIIEIEMQMFWGMQLCYCYVMKMFFV